MASIAATAKIFEGPRASIRDNDTSRFSFEGNLLSAAEEGGIAALHLNDENDSNTNSFNNNSALVATGDSPVTTPHEARRRTKAALTMFNVIIEKFLMSVSYKNWRANQIGHICAAMATFNANDDDMRDSGRSGSVGVTAASASGGSVGAPIKSVKYSDYLTAPATTSNSSKIPLEIRHNVNLILDKILMRELSNCSQWLIILLTSLHDSIVPIMLTSSRTLNNAVLYVNEGFVNTFGFEYDEIKGRNAFEIVFQHSADINPELAYLGYRKNGNPFMSMIVSKDIRAVSGLPLYKLSLFPISPGEPVICSEPIAVSAMESKRAQRYHALMNTLPENLYVY
jgi:hypothetical protein